MGEGTHYSMCRKDFVESTVHPEFYEKATLPIVMTAGVISAKAILTY